MIKHYKFLEIFALVTLFLSTAFAGGNSSGGTDPQKVNAGAIKIIIENDGLKKAMINYLKTVQVEQIEDAVVRELLKKMTIENKLENDIQNSKYLTSGNCKDAYGKSASASTSIGVMASDICFDTTKLASSYQGLDDENIMVQLASVAFHEHVHHFQKFSTQTISENEDQANRLGGYILITAKFVQLPLLRWTRPGSGPEKFQEIESLYNLIRSKERAFLAPLISDYAKYPNFQGQLDKGIIRLLPLEKFSEKLSVRGSAAYYSFTRLTHEYGYGSDISFERRRFSVGFAGCDFGYILKLGQMSLDQIGQDTDGMSYLYSFMPANTEPEIRKQQQEARTLKVNGFSYANRTEEINVDDTFVIRSVNFYNSDVLVAIKVIRFDIDGSVLIAWKKLKTFPVSKCSP